MTIDSFMALISYSITVFTFGFMLGKEFSKRK